MNTYLVAAAYLFVLVLTIRARVYWCFAIYLCAELAKVAVYEPGMDWYVWIEAGVLVARLAAVAEAWYYLTWAMQCGERRALAVAATGAGFGFAAIALMVWPLDTTVSAFNQVRLGVHLIALAELGVAAAWLTLHPVRMPRGALRHAWTLAAYVGLFVAAGLYRAETMEEWEAFRLAFRAGILICLAAFCQEQLSQFSHLRAQLTYLGRK